jgi:hypothetical protein
LAQKSVIDELPAIFADEATQLVHIFEVKNDSPTAQKVSSVTPHCGCAKAIIEKLALMPGEQTKLHLQADLNGKRGPQTFSCDLNFESGKTWTYSVKTVVQPRMAFNPPELHFGLVEPSKTISRIVEIVTRPIAGAQDQAAVQLTTSTDLLRVSQISPEVPLLERHEIGTTRTQNVRIDLLGDTLPGTHWASVRATFRDGAQQREFLLWISWRVKNYYEVSPAQLLLRTDDDSNVLPKLVRIKRFDGEPLIIRAVKVTNPAIECTAEIGTPRREHKLTVVVRDGGNRRLTQANLEIETDLAIQPKLELPVTAINVRLLKVREETHSNTAFRVGE